MNSIIEKSIANETPIEIIYWAGSQPGSKRLIQPVAIEGDKLRAVCLATGQIKLFFLNKIDIDNLDNPGFKSYRLGAVDHQAEILNLHQISKTFIDQLTADGWHVIITEVSLGVHLKYKNGTPHKTAEVDLLYFQERCDEVTGECHPSVRPWYVRGKKTGQARTFKDLHSALDHFIELAKKSKEIIDDRRTLHKLQKADTAQ